MRAEGFVEHMRAANKTVMVGVQLGNVRIMIDQQPQLLAAGRRDDETRHHVAVPV
jgi:hypothetical protein